ncbi:MAG: hypothetical protein V3S29_09710, partial [bacterium]
GGSGPPGGGGGNGDESFLQRVLGAVSNVPGAVLSAVADVSPIALYGGLGGILVLGGAGGFLMIKKFRVAA